MADNYHAGRQEALCVTMDAGVSREGKGDHEIWYGPLTKRRSWGDARISRATGRTTR